MKTPVTHPLLFATLLTMGCSKTLYPVPHDTRPELLPNGAPSGEFYEPKCLKPGKAYTLALDHAVLYGRVIKMKNHERLASRHKKALAANDTLVFRVTHFVTDSTNYLHATHTALMQGHGFHMKDSQYVATLHHGDIRSFNCFGSSTRIHVTNTPLRYESSPHVVTNDWQGTHLCPLALNEPYLLQVVSTSHRDDYQIIFGTITGRNNNRLTVQVRNEVTAQTNVNALAMDDIMKYGIGFPKHYAHVQKEIDHEQIIAFRPATQVNARTKPPQSAAGQTGGATLLLLVAMVAGIIALF